MCLFQGVLGYFQAQLAAIVGYTELQTKVFQSLREIGNTTVVATHLEQALVSFVTKHLHLCHPFIYIIFVYCEKNPNPCQTATNHKIWMFKREIIWKLGWEYEKFWQSRDLMKGDLVSSWVQKKKPIQCFGDVIIVKHIHISIAQHKLFIIIIITMFFCPEINRVPRGLRCRCWRNYSGCDLLIVVLFSKIAQKCDYVCNINTYSSRSSSYSMSRSGGIMVRRP